MNDEALVARLLEFEAPNTDALLDGALDEAVATATAAPGLRRLVLAERAEGTNRQFALLTIWRDDAAMQAAVEEGSVPVYHVALARYLASARLSTFAPDVASLRLSADALQSIELGWGTGPHEVGASQPSVVLSGDVGAAHLTLIGYAGRERRGLAAIFSQLGRVAPSSTMPGAEYLVRADVTAALEA